MIPLVAVSVAAVGALGAAPSRAPRQPAETSASWAPLVVGDHRSVELVNLGGSSGEALLARVEANIGAAVAAVEAFWGTGWSHRIVVTAAGTDRQFAALASGSLGDGEVANWADIAAVTVADHVDPRLRLVTGQQVVFAPGAVEMNLSELRIVLTHELFHYATRVDTAVDAPRWLVEGVADYVARGAATGELPPVGHRAPGPPSDVDLAAGPARGAAYEQAWRLTRFIADRYGSGALRRLYLAACAPGHGDLAGAIHRVTGKTLPDVLADWRYRSGQNAD